jgi:hypothetical protein
MAGTGERELLELFGGGDAANQATFAAVVTTFAAELASGQVGLRIETLRDEDHMRAFKDGKEPLDGFNLSADIETATKLRDQLSHILAELARKRALKN